MWIKQAIVVDLQRLWIRIPVFCNRRYADFKHSEPGVSAPCLPPPAESIAFHDLQETTDLQFGTDTFEKSHRRAQHSIVLFVSDAKRDPASAGVTKLLRSGNYLIAIRKEGSPW